MLCTKCGFEGSPNLEEVGPHTKATCQKCGAYIKMMSKKELKAQVNNTTSTMNTLTIKTNVPIEFMEKVFKRIKISLMNGYKTGEGEIGSFLSDDPYIYSFEYKE